MPFRFEASIQWATQGARWLLTAFVLSTLALAANAAGADAPASEARTDPDPRQQADIEEGKTRFIQICAYCHGQEGEAGKTRPFRSRTDWDPQVIFDTIANGRVRGGNVMPAWKDTIPPEDIWKIVAYIKSLSASTPVVVAR